MYDLDSAQELLDPTLNDQITVSKRRIYRPVSSLTHLREDRAYRAVAEVTFHTRPHGGVEAHRATKLEGWISQPYALE